MKLATLLNLLPVVGPAIAATAEFKAMFDEAKEAMSSDDQEVMKRAYDLAVERAGNNHQQLQDLCQRYGGTG